MPSSDEADPRRGFLKLVVAALGATGGVVATVPGLALLSHPLRRKTVTGGEEPIRVRTVPAEILAGTPVRVDLVADRQDGWLKLAKVRVGAAWLVRSSTGQIRAFSTVCPHLGCGIDWDAGAEKLMCPCHQSAFATDGTRLAGPAPRDLDELEVIATEAEIRVRYQRFRPGSKLKEPIG
jgi:menaquinol-cytochrome c reductase iron-sulfur subunit